MPRARRRPRYRSRNLRHREQSPPSLRNGSGDAGPVALGYTVFGRATGTSQITGEALVTTTVVNSALSVMNPIGNSTALTITPLAGGASPVAASLVIQQLN